METKLRLILTVLLVLGFPNVMRAYGPIGHQTVGAIADECLANTDTGKRVNELLDGITLEKASVIPDEIKGWDKKGADDPKIFHYSAHPKIDEQLRAFWRANQPTHDLNSAMPSHHWFHYTDVPVLNPEKYSDGKAGRSRWDIVHMISYCVEVLQGRVPENNERKITKPVAVILLAHYVGDIHQPLHVGAQHFNQQGEAVDPDRDSNALEDEGGNTITLKLATVPQITGNHSSKLHPFWDNDAVMANLPALPGTMPKEERRQKMEVARRQFVKRLASREPHVWRTPPSVDPKNYAEVWANEILPIAREAHQRLRFERMHPQQDEDRIVAAGEAVEEPRPDRLPYAEWAASIVRDELHKAGWRLADLLEKALSTGAGHSSPTPSSTSPTPSPLTTPMVSPKLETTPAPDSGSNRW